MSLLCWFERMNEHTTTVSWKLVCDGLGNGRLLPRVKLVRISVATGGMNCHVLLDLLKHLDLNN
jgi:hypothetical protein